MTIFLTREQIKEIYNKSKDSQAVRVQTVSDKITFIIVGDSKK